MHLTWEELPEKIPLLLLKLDEIPWKKISKPLFIKSLNFLARSKDRAELEAKWVELEKKAAKRLSFNLLAKRGYFSKELERRLAMKQLSSLAIDYALAECRRLGYLDDEREKIRFIEKEKSRGRGPQLIALKLKARGVVTEIEMDQIAEMKRLLKTRFQKRALQGFKERQKIAQAFLRRGFDFEIIKEFLYKNYNSR